MFPHPVFQVAGHICVEYSLGFTGHDVDYGLFYDRCAFMDSRLRGTDGGEFCGTGWWQRRNNGESFAGMAGGSAGMAGEAFAGMAGGSAGITGRAFRE